MHSRLIGLWSAALCLLACSLVALAAQPTPDALPPPPPLAGIYRVAYTDAVLGPVKGQAIIDKGDKQGRVRYTLPPRNPGDFERTFDVVISGIERSGDKVKLTLTGTFPSGPRVLPPDIRGLARVPLAEAQPNQPPARATATARDLTRAVPVQRVKRPEADIVHLEFTRSSLGDLSGQWSYTADPVTERDLHGVGRVGTFTLQDTEESLSGEQRGEEAWSPKRPVIERVLVMQDQYAVGPAGPLYPWPFAPGVKPRLAETRRSLFVYGHDLPKRSEPASFESLSPGMTNYWLEVAADGDPGNPLSAERVQQGWKRARVAAAAMGKKLDPGAFEAVLVTAGFDRKVTPGWQEFTLNHAPATWLLGFGDLQGTLRFARPLSEDTPPTRAGDDVVAGESEPLDAVMLREYVQIECDVQTTIASLKTVDVAIARNGEDGIKVTLTRAALPMPPRKPWQEVTPPPSRYRSPLIRLVDADHPPTSPSRPGSVDLPCKVKDKLTAVAADPAKLDVRRPAEARVILGPSDLGPMWKDALRIAAACRGIDSNYDWSTITKEQADEVANYCFADITPRKGLQVLVNLFNPIQLDKLEPLKRRTAITIGDHAAMILLRRQVEPLLDKQSANLAKVAGSNELLMAWGRAIQEACAVGDNPLGQLEVTKPPRAGLEYGIRKISFGLACNSSFLDKMFPGEPDAAANYFLGATREVFTQYRDAATKAAKRAHDASDCDVKELLEITGTGFDAVVEMVIPRLMKLEEQGTPPELVWAPDRVARGYVRGLARLAEAVKAQQDYAKLDTEFALLIAGGIASMPAIVSESFVAALISFALNAGIFDATAIMALHDQYKNDQEYTFALGARGVLGDDRLSEALLSKTEWWQTLAMLAAQGVLTGLDGVGVIFKADLEAAKEAAPGLLRKVRQTEHATDGLRGLSPFEKQQLLTAISDAEQAALRHGLDNLTPEQRALFDLSADLHAEARPTRAAAVHEPASSPVRPEPEAHPGTPASTEPVRPTEPTGDRSITDAVTPPKPEPAPTTSEPRPSTTKPEPTSSASEPRPPTTKPEPSPVPSEPRPSTTKPEPSPTPSEPRPSTTRPEPAPTPSEPRPSTTKPEPASPPSEPRPSTTKPEPAPTPSEPRPSTTKPEPASPPSEPRPSTTKPEPSPTPSEPRPSSTKPEPAPTASEPRPSTTKPEPSATEPVGRHDGATEPAKPPVDRNATTNMNDSARFPNRSTELDPAHPEPSATEPVGRHDGATEPAKPPVDRNATTNMNDSARFPNRSTELETASTPKLDEWRVESETLPMPRPEERLPSTIDEPHAEPVKPPAPAEPAHPGPGPTPKPAPEARPPMPGGLNHVDPPAGAIEVPTAPVAGESHAGKVYGALPEFTPPPADAKVDANTLRQMQDDFKAAWKNEKFLYRDAKGRVYQIEGVLGEGQFNRAYRLGGEGNEGRIMKVRLKDQYGGTGPGTLADRAQAVRESKALSDELARRGIPDLRIHDAVVDNDPPYVIMDLADPKKGYRILGRDIKEGYIPPSVDPVTGRPLTREEVDKALLQHLASKGIDRRHGEALRDLIDRIASEGWAAEDLKFDNVYFREEGGKVTAGIADHERIGPMDQPDLRDWQEYYNPYSAADKAKGKIKHRELLMETLDRSQQQIDALQAKSPRSAADEDALQRALAAQAATRKGMAKVDGDLDNLLAKSLNRSRIRSLAAVPVEQRLGIDLAKADPRYWAAKMFEHNGWVYYDAAAGNFRPSWIDPEWLKPKFDLDGYLGPPPLKPGALRLVPWPWAPVIACAPPVRRAA